MKKRLVLIAAMAMALACSSAAWAKAILWQNHQQWSSFWETDGQEAKMMSSAQNSAKTYMIISYGMDGKYVMDIVALKNTPDRKTKPPVTVTIQSRVDSNPVFYTQGSLRETNDSFIIRLGTGFHGQFIEQSIKGDNFRVKLADGLIYRFSLYGFTAAYARAQSLRQQMGSGSDESYFRKQPPAQRPRRKPDSAYF